MSTTREYFLCLSKNIKYSKNLLELVYDQQVVLENIFTRNLTLYGSIRVNNCSFNKQVYVQSTIDQWKTCFIINAYYSTHYSDNNTDLFQFKWTIPKLAKNISFAICYSVDNQEFWDNNYSQNYNFEIIQKKTNNLLHEQIAEDYHAVSNPPHQPGNLCGLKNLNGTCYMNSILQSLSFTSLLVDYFLSNQYIKDNELIVINEFWNLLYLLCCGKYRVITPIPFKQILGYIKYVYMNDQQQDAHEFLTFLLDYMHTELNSIKPTEITTNFDRSILTDLFYGTYQSTITCLECMHASRTLESFLCLTLQIPMINQCTLEDCLTYLNEEEYLTDDSKWFCPKCQCLCNAKRRLEIYKLPKILIIQLKRFQLDFEMNWIKNDTLVLYPEDNLNINQYSYTLYSVVNHDGSINDGHYTTFSRNLSLNRQAWFECDDEIIKSITIDKLHLNSKAYLLFYTIEKISKL